MNSFLSLAKTVKKLLVEQFISKGDLKLPIKLITFRLVVISSLKNIHSLFLKEQKQIIK